MKDFCPHNLISYGYKIEDIFQLYESIKFSKKLVLETFMFFGKK